LQGHWGQRPQGLKSFELKSLDLNLLTLKEVFKIKIRLLFSKFGSLRFIGHLDFLRVFQQTIRRAGLPMAFSQGFNPHLLISFALPLPLGMVSVNDYADITLETEIPCAEIVEKLNAVAPDGLLIKRAYLAENKAASVVAVADYALQVREGALEEISHAIGEIVRAETIVIPKKTKKGVKDTDIRPDILGIHIDDAGIVVMRLSAGSARFLHPMLVAELITKATPSAADITRLELYYPNEAEELLPL